MKIAFLVLLIFTNNLWAACNLGKVNQVSGEAKLERNGQTFRLDTDIYICNGDKITTDPSSVVVVKLRDDSIITVGKDSEFIIQNYHIYKSKPNEASFELLKGAFRSVTGFITKRPHRYEVHTPTATIGVRGTDFWGGYGITPDGLDVIMLSGHGVYVKDLNGNVVELDKAGLGTTVVNGQPPLNPVIWGEEKINKAVATITP